MITHTALIKKIDDGTWSSYGSGQDKLRRASKSNTYQPLGAAEFKTLLRTGMDFFTRKFNRAPKSFCDIGCGVGDKLRFAVAAGLDADGIELNKTLVKYCRVVAPTSIIWNLDLYNFDGLDQYDILYAFNPTFDRSFINFLSERMANESIILDVACMWSGEIAPLACMPTSRGRIWFK